MSDELMHIIEWAFDRAALKRVCEMPEQAFADKYGMKTVEVDQREPDNHYYFKDNGSDILAVAHLDTVVRHNQRKCTFVDTEAGTVVHSGALDDRLGAYIILELLPALGITHDILLTVGEESGLSTASYFEVPEDKDYNWIIEFDRGGTDVVMYDYETDECEALVKASGARFGQGIFTDICYLEHVGVKGFNWGVGYQDYHSTRGYAYLEDTFEMVGYYLAFHAVNSETFMPHTPQPRTLRWWDDESYMRDAWKEDKYFVTCENCGVKDAVDLDTAWCDECDLCNDCWSPPKYCECKQNARLVAELNDESPEEFTEEEAEVIAEAEARSRSGVTEEEYYLAEADVVADALATKEGPWWDEEEVAQ